MKRRWLPARAHSAHGPGEKHQNLPPGEADLSAKAGQIVLCLRGVALEVAWREEWDLLDWLLSKIDLTLSGFSKLPTAKAKCSNYGNIETEKKGLQSFVLGRIL